MMTMKMMTLLDA
ncbi:rCG40091, partial [Rattus norvegicus]